MDYLKTVTVKEIEEIEEGYLISSESIRFGLEKKYCAVPKVGDNITLHCIEETRQIRGVDINGDCIFYLTDEQAKAEKQAVKEKIKELILKMIKPKDNNLKEELNTLPDVFQRRIEHFRDNTPNFREELELLEIFCCKEAFKMVSSLTNEREIMAFRVFYEIFKLKAKHDGKKADDPLLYGALSCTLSLVNDYLDSPEKVINTKGALTALVGSEEYGQ